MNAIDSMKAGFTKRLEVLKQQALGKDPKRDIPGALGVYQFYKGDKAIGEEIILRTANWFKECPYVRPDGTRRLSFTECDFAANRLVRVLYAGTAGLSDATIEAIKAFFLENDFESWYKSENHMLIFHMSRYLAGYKYPNEVFKAYGKTGSELIKEEIEYITHYLTFRGQRSWGEFDSVGYLMEDMGALMTLYDYAPDEKLRDLAKMSMDMILIDMLSDMLGSNWCGAHGRVYEGFALDHNSSAMLTLAGLYFGGYDFDAREADFSNIACDLLMTEYIPSDFVFAFAAERPTTYENYEAKNLHSITCPTPHKQTPQEKGNISKYTHITPQYAIGGVCFQDEYENPEAAWYAHHQQYEWELAFPNSTEAHIFTHHPGSHGQEGAEHGYWTGDLGCNCGTFYTNDNKSVAMYDIPDGEEYEINAHVKFDLFNIVEDEHRMFLEYENRTYAMLYFSQGYYRKDGKYADCEVRSAGRKHGVVCEVGTKTEYGSFEAFIDAMRKKSVVFDDNAMTLEYDNIRITKTERFLNGNKVAFPFDMIKNPMVSAKLGSGIVEIETSLGKTVLDFNKIEVR